MKGCQEDSCLVESLGKSMEICESTTTPVSQDSFWAKPASREAKKLNHHNNEVASNSNGSSTRFSIQSQLRRIKHNKSCPVGFLKWQKYPKAAIHPQDVFWMFHDLSRYFMIFPMLQQHSATLAGGIGSCQRRASKCPQGHAVFTFVWRFDDLKESLKCSKEVRWLCRRIHLDTLGTRWDVDKSLWLIRVVELHNGFPFPVAVAVVCLIVMKSVTCIVCARIMITWLKRWKVVRRTHAWWKAWENPWKYVKVQPRLSPKTLFEPSLLQEKLRS